MYRNKEIYLKGEMSADVLMDSTLQSIIMTELGIKYSISAFHYF